MTDDETCSECGRVDHPAYMCWRVGHLVNKATAQANPEYAVPVHDPPFVTPRSTPTSDFCVSCDTHLSEVCWVCHGKLEKQRDDLLAACEALMALEWWANEQTGAVEADGKDKVYAQARAAIAHAKRGISKWP